jgi:hypothetical protein
MVGEVVSRGRIPTDLTNAAGGYAIRDRIGGDVREHHRIRRDGTSLTDAERAPPTQHLCAGTNIYAIADHNPDRRAARTVVPASDCDMVIDVAIAPDLYVPMDDD